MHAEETDVVIQTKRKRNKLRTIKLFLKATEQVIGEQGIDKAHISLISERANLNKVLVYRYFGGWNGLIEALFENYLMELKFAAELAVDSAYFSRQEAFVKAYSQLLITNRAFAEYIRWMSLNKETILAEKMLENQQKVFGELLPPYLATKQLIQLLLSGLCYQSLLLDTNSREKQIIHLEATIGQFFILLDKAQKV